MARRERSAGIVVFRAEQADDAQRAYLLLDYGRHWDFAKGHVNRGEEDRAAALRELREETGIDDVALIPGFAHEITYHFRGKQKQLIRKTVVFFLGRVAHEKIILSDEHVGYAFQPFEEAIRTLTYPTARQTLQLAEAHLQRLAK